MNTESQTNKSAIIVIVAAVLLLLLVTVAFLFSSGSDDWSETTERQTEIEHSRKLQAANEVSEVDDEVAELRRLLQQEYEYGFESKSNPGQRLAELRKRYPKVENRWKNDYDRAKLEKAQHQQKVLAPLPEYAIENYSESYFKGFSISQVREWIGDSNRFGDGSLADRIRHFGIALCWKPYSGELGKNFDWLGRFWPASESELKARWKNVEKAFQQADKLLHNENKRYLQAGITEFFQDDKSKWNYKNEDRLIQNYLNGTDLPK